MLSFIVLSLTATAAAVTINISNTNITADTNVQITISDPFQAGSNYDPSITAIKLYLFSLTQNWIQCAISPFINVNSTSTTVQVPASVGPSGAYYAFAALAFSDAETNTLGTFIHGPDYSDYFFLSGGKGEWTTPEMTAEFDRYVAPVPCTSYDCMRQCAKKQAPTPTNNAWQNGTVWTACLQNCPGVQIQYADVPPPVSTPTEIVIPATGTCAWCGSESTTMSSNPNAPLPTPTEACSVEKFETPCGTECCDADHGCLFYHQCWKIQGNESSSGGGDVESTSMGLHFGSATTTPAVSSTATTSKTSAAVTSMAAKSFASTSLRHWDQWIGMLIAAEVSLGVAATILF
jgi:hypothetical protein